MYFFLIVCLCLSLRIVFLIIIKYNISIELNPKQLNVLKSLRLNRQQTPFILCQLAGGSTKCLLCVIAFTTPLHLKKIISECLTPLMEFAGLKLSKKNYLNHIQLIIPKKPGSICTNLCLYNIQSKKCLLSLIVFTK